jgi:chloramphenicol O-acetyltransferase type A
MPTYLDTERWSRSQQFHFFKTYDQPFFNICAPLDVTELLRLSRSEGGPAFFLTYHYLALRAANEEEPFRYRLRGDRVLVHDRIDMGTTILLDGERFAFCYFEYDEDGARFLEKASAAVESLRASDGRLRPSEGRDDLVHCSVIPWISFTSFSHARMRIPQDSVPKLVFGKYFADGDRFRMPVSVEVHHALMDGVHVGRYFERLERFFADPAALLALDERGGPL